MSYITQAGRDNKRRIGEMDMAAMLSYPMHGLSIWESPHGISGYSGCSGTSGYSGISGNRSNYEWQTYRLDDCWVKIREIEERVERERIWVAKKILEQSNQEVVAE